MVDLGSGSVREIIAIAQSLFCCSNKKARNHKTKNE
jgi:hypothetical protein